MSTTVTRNDTTAAPVRYTAIKALKLAAEFEALSEMKQVAYLRRVAKEIERAYLNAVYVKDHDAEPRLLSEAAWQIRKGMSA